MFSFLKKVGRSLRKKKGPFTVVGIGQCSWDYLSLVDIYPVADTKKEVLQFAEQGGGPVATALVTLSSLGTKSRFCGIIGDDTEGDKIGRSLVESNVDISGLLLREGTSSQVAHIVIGKNEGTRTIFWKRPSSEPLKPDDLEDSVFDRADFLLLDGLMKDVSLHAVKMARERKVPVMLDAGRVREGMLDLARLCDYVVGSKEFAKELGWHNNPEEFKGHILNLGFGITTITLGGRGSVTFAHNEVIETPAVPVNVVDTTGAGDVFHGAYIYGLLQEWKLRSVLTFASAVAAMKCREIGGRDGIPQLDDVMNFLEEQKIKLF